MGGGFCKGWAQISISFGHEEGFLGALLPCQVLKQLQSKYGELYRHDNVILSGTHTHSGPGGYFQYTLFWITSKGLVRPTLYSIVNGIVKVAVTQFSSAGAQHGSGCGAWGGTSLKHAWRWDCGCQ